MGEFQLQEEESLRIAAPNLYKRLIETFGKYNIHPYDTHSFVKRNDTGLEITLKYSANFSECAKKQISFEQAHEPCEEITIFFEETAEKCKSRLISDYYKMIKP